MFTRRIPGLMTALTLTALTGLALTAKPAQAQTDFTFTITNPNIVAPAGTTAIFNGTLTFTGTPSSLGASVNGTGSIYFAGVQFDSSFVSFLSSSLTAGSSYMGAIFGIGITPGAPVGASVITNSIVSVGDASGQIATPITLTVGPAATTTPEPASYAAFAMGGIGLLGLGLKARKRNL